MFYIALVWQENVITHLIFEEFSKKAFSRSKILKNYRFKSTVFIILNIKKKLLQVGKDY